MIYDKIRTLENGKLAKCPVCDNEETDIDGYYCQICGSCLINRCINEDCGTYLKPNFRFCPICGAESVFKINNMLTDWSVEYGKNFMAPSFEIDMPYE